VSSNKVSEFHL